MASHFGEDSDHQVRVSKSFPFEDKNQNDSKDVVAENTHSEVGSTSSTCEPLNKPRSTSAPPSPTQSCNPRVRRKRFNSLRLIDSINGITGTRSQPLKKGWKKPSKQKINSQPITPTSVSNHDDILISDSLSKINRCNLRILSRPKPTTSSESIEVDKIVHLAYDYEFKKSDGKSGGIIAIWYTSCFSRLAFKEGDGFVAVKEDFGPLFHNSWSCVLERPSSKAIIFNSKLQRLKASIKQWHHMSQASENSSLNALRDTLLAIDLKAESNNLSIQDIKVRSMVVKQLFDFEHFKSKDLRQKAKSKWALEGDENSTCLGSAYTSVLINGSPTREFKLKKGLRQDDPLSPLLFILAVEALNVALLEAKNNDSFRMIEVGKDKVCVSHLQFADDALIMGEWSKINVLNLSRLLTCFHLASGLKVNFNKSKLFGIGVCEVERNSLASLIGCQPSNFPCNYLGLPIGANMSRCDNWLPLLERFHKRLSSWKAKTLSFGGRLTLSKSILGSLRVYYFSIFKAPKMVIKKLESIRRKFFWGGGLDSNKIAWIAWDKVISPLKDGGLDIGSLRIEDWKWRINKFLEGSLGGKFFSLQCLPKPTHLVSTLGVSTAPPRTSARIGVTGPPGLSFQWAWSRELRSTPDHEELIILQNLLANLHLSINPDTWVCMIDSLRIFFVKGMRKLISKSLNISYAPTTSWNNLVLKKVNITSWRVVNQRTPTRLNLSNRDIDLDSILCPICNEEIKTEEHLFVKCEIEKKTWAEVLKWWNICNVHLENINDIFSLKN
ncbi:putative RNA-directed DNA polymerase, eukaryota, reverse transcriptase zinc-binding domain protein [Tanacetum coccineum]